MIGKGYHFISTDFSIQAALLHIYLLEAQSFSHFGRHVKDHNGGLLSWPSDNQKTSAAFIRTLSDLVQPPPFLPPPAPSAKALLSPSPVLSTFLLQGSESETPRRCVASTHGRPGEIHVICTAPKATQFEHTL